MSFSSLENEAPVNRRTLKYSSSATGATGACFGSGAGAAVSTGAGGGGGGAGLTGGGSAAQATIAMAANKTKERFMMEDSRGSFSPEYAPWFWPSIDSA